MPRLVLPEVLDGLPAHDPAAQRARRDLQRVHRAMGTHGMLLRALRALPVRRAGAGAGAGPGAGRPLQVLELGAGDGSLMLGVARALHGTWPTVALTLLDRQPLLAASTVADYAAVGWAATAQTGDALAWAAGHGAARLTPTGAPRWDLVVANLFLHHFTPAPLAMLLAAVAARSDAFFACEPRRGRLALAGSHLVGMLGANAVTRADAVTSVRAGFLGNELQALWPAGATGWTLAESSAGLFSHCFAATRVAAVLPGAQ